MAQSKYDIGYQYSNKYGTFKIIDKNRQSNRWIYSVRCLKCGHVSNKKQNEILVERKCLGCVHNMEYSFYNVGDVVNGLIVLKKSPAADKNGYIIKEYICKCVVDNKIVKIKESHLKDGVGCMECAARKRGENQRKEHDKYITDVELKNPFVEIVGRYIDQYTKIEYNCKVCGYNGKSLPNNLLRGGGCPVCDMSIGEKKIMKYLIDNCIKYESQYTFDDCKNIFVLPFDFYLPEYNTCIEYDGEQHFKPIDCFGGEEKLKKTQNNDNIKTQYCKNNGINLLRIKYDQNIEKELNIYFSKCQTNVFERV